MRRPLLTKKARVPAEIVQVYEKIAQGIWCDRGKFELVDANIINDAQEMFFDSF